jgi:hypothetical protein
MQQECHKHILAIIYFEGAADCPLCSTAHALWYEYRYEFDRGRIEGVRNMTVYPLYAHKRSVYNFPNRMIKNRGRDKNGYLIK